MEKDVNKKQNGLCAGCLSEMKLLMIDNLKDGCEYGRSLYAGYHSLAESMARQHKRIDTMRDDTFPRLFGKIEKIEGSMDKAREAAEGAEDILEENRKLLINSTWRRMLEYASQVLITVGAILGLLKLTGKF